eukprot:TRINITY_DN2271_c0_g3_i1.p1 TRINITY_DN2271_c0_g3~~TRINITY_DN2271_c0_g3_i1.p1  ORF type:complete len:550 (+),score=112.49 TRINITY_DN2271_c0_g3_i1:95-1651(+)
MAGAFAQANDDSFYVMLFGFVAFACCLLAIEPFVRGKAYYDETVASFKYTSKVIKVLCSPSKVTNGINFLKGNMPYTRHFVFPLAKKIFTKWRLMLWGAFIVLFSIVAYQTLSFDPHQILNLKPDATPGQIKKSYRKLSMKLHPDVNSTEEAARQYSRVKKAYHMLTKPDERIQNEADVDAQGPGVGLPSFLTNPEYAAFSMTLLLGLLFSAPFYMLFALKQKKTDETSIPYMIRCVKYAKMAETMFHEIGMPQYQENTYEVEQAPKLISLLEKLETAQCFETPEEEIPMKPSEAALFFPELCSETEVKELLKESINGNRSAQAQLSKHLLIFINTDKVDELQAILDAHPITDSDKEALATYKELKKGDGKKTIDNLVFNPYTDEKEEITKYFLEPLLGEILMQADIALPCLNPQQRGLETSNKLRQAYITRFDNLKLLKKQAAERGDAKELPRMHKESLLNTTRQHATSLRIFADMISELKNRCKMFQKRQESALRSRNKKILSGKGKMQAPPSTCC